MGQKAAEFVTTGKQIRVEVPTTLKVRASI
jgi:hypothetical protein